MEKSKILGQLYIEREIYGVFLLTESQVRLLEYLGEYLDVEWWPLSVDNPKEI